MKIIAVPVVLFFEQSDENSEWNCVDLTNEILHEHKKSLYQSSLLLDYVIDNSIQLNTKSDKYNETERLLELSKHVQSTPIDVPTVILNIEGGLIHCVTSDKKVDVIILDSDIEGGGGENIHEINGEYVYVSYARSDVPHRLNPDYVEHTKDQVVSVLNDNQDAQNV